MAVYVYSPFLFTQSTPQAVWTVTHKFYREVTVAVFDSTGMLVYPRIERINSSALRISFFEKGVPVAKTGKVTVG